MSKILVLVQDYPNLQKGIALMYVHTRNRYYVRHGLDVTVLNFSARNDYIVDGVRVITEETYKKEHAKYECLILHAANIKNHYRFLRFYGDRFGKYVFFYHGHEVLKINDVYSKPYGFVRSSLVKNCVQNLYDSFKLAVWHNYLPKVREKSYFIFVSNWMLDEFLKWVKISIETLNGRYSITYNSVGTAFEKMEYDASNEKKYDFVTIRGNLDGSKYCVDLVNELAKSNSSKRFLLIGKGNFFKHYEKAVNIDWWDKTLNHEEIVKVLQQSKCALMPTRTDAQGLMVCEMATFGIPVITSDIPVCHEVFDEFDNVSFIDNTDVSCDLSLVYKRLEKKISKMVKNRKYFTENTCAKEVEILKKLF